jgi:eukaryotic-like serine/threonine-protein kinase
VPPPGYVERVGLHLDERYTLDALVGWGGAAAVYRATDRDGTRVAIKMLDTKLSTDRAAVQRFLREAYVADAIPHRCICHVRGDGVALGSAYLVMEHLEGSTLEDIRLDRGGRLPVSEVLFYSDELLSALVAVHAAGVLHRDLKPQNVYVTDTGAVKLLDFGIAHVRSAGERSSIEGLAIGSPSFMPPEQARGEQSRIDETSDLWALGATLFTAFSGEYVHAARDPHQRLLSAATRPARALVEVAPWVDPEIAEIIDRALSFDQADRWLSAAEMRRALREAQRIDSSPPSSQRVG